jgi:hypothetical protein
MKKKVFILSVTFFVFVNCLPAFNGVGGSESETKTSKGSSSFISTATDYFRSVSSGNWDNLLTWESSADSLAWSAATLIPGASAEHVVIQGSDSVFITGNRTTKNLTILSGAKMNALIFTMMVSSRFNLLGTAFFYQGGIVSEVPGVEQVLAPASTYYYNGTQVGLNAALPEFGNLVFAASSASPGTFENTVAAAPFYYGLVVRGDLTIDLQQPLAQDISFATGSTVSRTHTIDGDLNIANNRTIVIIQRGDAVSSTTGTVNIGGNLNNNTGFLFALGYTATNSGTAIINLSGDINNFSGLISTGLSTAGLYTLNFVGTSPQSFNNSSGTLTNTVRQNVNINNPSGVTFNTPVILQGNLNFVTGILKTTFINLLTLGQGSTVTGVSDSGFVHGPVKKIGNTAFTFPVGKTGFGYVPIGISNFFGGTPTDEFTAEYMRGSARDLGPIGAAPGLVRVSGCDYWVLDKIKLTPESLDITAYWNINNTCIGNYIDDPDSVTIAHFNGTNWNSFATNKLLTPGSTSAAGSVTWLGATEFSPFALASTSVLYNPLPININYFTGSRQNNSHVLNWKVTCVSSPSATLEMERSTDGRNFKTIYSIFATALRCQQPFNYTDDKPATGINYYRLKITDAEGKITYSSMISLINAAKGNYILNIAPNPVVGGKFDLKVSAAKNELMELVITDIQGRVMQVRSVALMAGFNSIPVHVSNLPKGTYQLYGKWPDEQTKIVRFVVQ